MMGIKQFVKQPRVWPLYQKAKRFYCWLVGERGFYATHDLLEKFGSLWAARAPALSMPPYRCASGKKFCLGLNIAGSIVSEGGVAEGVRTNILAVKAAGIPYTLNRFDIGRSPNTVDSYIPWLLQENTYDINLIHLNPNKVLIFHDRMGPNYFRGKYNIGFWAWELSTFPHKWHDRFNCFHEIWTPSAFCLEALAPVSPVTVRKVMHAVEVKTPRKSERKHLGIPEEWFVFLFIFDFYSTFERKNPLAVIEALKTAFSPKEPVALVLKFYNSEVNPKDHDRLRKSASGYSIKLVDGYLSKDKTHDLLACCDAYVSLHRSEGFGLTMAEAMCLGTPVIATNYSGNTEFMNSNNSFLVKYQLKELERDFGLYKKGNVWADPDVEDAARWMRYVYENREAAQKIAAQGAEDIHRILSPQAIGDLIKKRIDEILEVSGNQARSAAPTH